MNFQEWDLFQKGGRQRTPFVRDHMICGCCTDTVSLAIRAREQHGYVYGPRSRVRTKLFSLHNFNYSISNFDRLRIFPL